LRCELASDGKLWEREQDVLWSSYCTEILIIPHFFVPPPVTYLVLDFRKRNYLFLKISPPKDVSGHNLFKNYYCITGSRTQSDALFAGALEAPLVETALVSVLSVIG
jgi:hypothetical protein